MRTASGATAVQIAERAGGRDKVIEHLGSAHTDAGLAVLTQTGRRKMHDGQGDLDLVLGERDSRQVVVRGQRSRILVEVIEVIEGAWRRLGSDVVGDDAFFRLVLARSVEPTGRADSVRVLSGLGTAPAHRNTFTATLKRCAQRGYRDQFATACSTHASTSGDVSLVLHDVTTSYFEAGNEDEPRKVGYSKERRVDPQIVVGLLVDRAGLPPPEIGCHEGDEAETTTIIPIVKQFQERHPLSGMVVVADAGMESATNLKDLDDAGPRFIVGPRVTKAPAGLASHFRWHGDAFTDGQLIDTITPRVATAAARGVNDPARRPEPVQAPAVHERSWRAVWAYSRKRATRDGHTPTPQENRAKEVVAGDKTARTPRFVTTKNGTQSQDETSPARARRLVGFKGYATNIPAGPMPTAQVLASHHDLWHVEASFRMSKTDLRARPIFHHTRDAIEAHPTIVYAALAIARYLQNATGISIPRLAQTLRPPRDVTISTAGQTVTAQPAIPDDIQAIIKKTTHQTCATRVILGVADGGRDRELSGHREADPRGFRGSRTVASNSSSSPVGPELVIADRVRERWHRPVRPPAETVVRTHWQVLKEVGIAFDCEA